MVLRSSGLFIGPAEGSVLTNPIGGQMTAKLRDTDTAQGYSMFDNILPAGSPGPRPHLHRHHEETFYVLEGELTLEIGAERRTLTPGAIAVIPRGVPHRPSNPSAHPTRVLLIFSPGGMDHFFDDAAAQRLPIQTVSNDPEKLAAMEAFSEKYGFAFADLPSVP